MPIAGKSKSALTSGFLEMHSVRLALDRTKRSSLNAKQRLSNFALRVKLGTCGVGYRSCQSLAVCCRLYQAQLVSQPADASSCNGNAAFQGILGLLLRPQLVPYGGQQPVLGLLRLVTCIQIKPPLAWPEWCQSMHVSG